MQESKYVKESVTFHNVPKISWVKLFLCQTIIFLSILLIMPQHSNCQKQPHFFNSHINPWGLSLDQVSGSVTRPGVQVLVILSVCCFHQGLYDFKKEEHGNGVESSVMCDTSVCHTSWKPCNPMNYRYSKLTVCTVCPQRAACIDVTCVSVSPKRNVFIFRRMCIRVQF